VTSRRRGLPSSTIIFGGVWVLLIAFETVHQAGPARVLQDNTAHRPRLHRNGLRRLLRQASSLYTSSTYSSQPERLELTVGHRQIAKRKKLQSSNLRRFDISRASCISMSTLLENRSHHLFCFAHHLWLNLLVRHRQKSMRRRMETMTNLCVDLSRSDC